jgi:hypothetical protein
LSWLFSKAWYLLAAFNSSLSLSLYICIYVLLQGVEYVAAFNSHIYIYIYIYRFFSKAWNLLAAVNYLVFAYNLAQRASVQASVRKGGGFIS